MRESHRPIAENEAAFTHEASPVSASAEETERERPSRGWSGCLMGFAQRMFLLLGFYVLSMGPMYWQWYGGRFAGGSQLVAAFYEPIFVMATLIPWFGEWMDWYVGLWIA